jgi:hypothetical protein
MQERMSASEYLAMVVGGKTPVRNSAPTPKKRFLIGLDPGVQTGISQYDRRDKCLLVCETTDFWGAIDRVFRLSDPADCVVYVEDASLIKFTFEQKGEGTYQDRISRNAGRIQRESELLIEGLQRAGYEVVRLKPSGKKWDAKEFQRITGWKGRTNQHQRDAARFVFNL